MNKPPIRNAAVRALKHYRGGAHVRSRSTQRHEERQKIRTLLRDLPASATRHSRSSQ